ncbi:MAG: signal peptidase II [Actinomycetota bacterium]|jgi:signal peptidase II|nr:signal peptidase II [Actinomycetota bacterium]
MTHDEAALDRRRSRLVAIALGVTVLLDLATKTWAIAALDDRNIDVVWKLRFHLVSNTGFAFSTGEGFGPLLGLIAIVISVVLWRARRTIDSTFGITAVGMVIGGAVGNLIDRIFRGDGLGRGGVVDFIDVQFWPVFNVADSAIVIGVATLVLHHWRADLDQPRTTADA